MPDFRRDLEAKSERFDLPPGGLTRLFERHRRKQRNLRIRAGVLSLVIAGVGTWSAVSAFRDVGTTQPGSSPSQADRRSYAQVAGTYVKTLTNEDPAVRANDMAGTYTMRLRRDGVMLLSLPPGFAVEGTSPTGIAFQLSGDRFTTNAFVNLTCAKTLGVYTWELHDDRLTLMPLDDSCEVRTTLFDADPWQRS